MNSIGIIVDGYSSGAGLAKEFLKLGAICIHVQSQQDIPKVYAHTYVFHDYWKHYIFQGDLSVLISELKFYSPKFVVAGAECGVDLADQLAHALNLPCNDIALSSARRNKYLMFEAIKAKDIKTILSYCASTLDQAIFWAQGQGIWPLIVKPLNSAGGEGVRRCDSINEVISAFSEIMNTKINMLGFNNQAVILQEYIEGEEYVVNMVSCKGEHKFCELWRYTRYQRPHGRQIYDTASLEEFQKEVHSDILTYAIEVIEALGMQCGPSHIEIIKNEQGCYLVEMGARLMGANLPFSLLQSCVSTSQAYYTVMAYADSRQFFKKLNTSYKVNKFLMAIFMVSNQVGKVGAINFIDVIQELPSFYDIKLAVQVGDMLKETIDYQTSPGMTYLAHEDFDVILSDKERIRVLEKNMFSLMHV